VTSLQAGLKDHDVICGKDKSFLGSKVPTGSGTHPASSSIVICDRFSRQNCQS